MGSTSLYTLLKEFVELRTRTIRTLDQYESVLWFAEIPQESECKIAAWRRGQEQDGEEV